MECARPEWVERMMTSTWFEKERKESWAVFHTKILSWIGYEVDA